jgi:hypothetical protein
MSLTIETLNINILNKLDFCIDILNELINSKIDVVDIKIAKKHIDELSSVKESYIFDTVSIITDYHNCYEKLMQVKEILTKKIAGPETPTKSSLEVRLKLIYSNYIKTCNSINISGKLSRVYDFCKKIEKNYMVDEPIIKELFNKYDQAIIDESYDDKIDDACKKCESRYYIDEKLCEFICYNCGHTEKMNGEVFNDEQFIYQEGQRTRHGKYDPTKHCKFWVDRIQARENIDIPEDIILSIKKCIWRDKIYVDSITCEIIRGYLKQLRLTQYNNYVPLIKKKITCKEPAQFNERELKSLFMYFSLVIQIFNKIKPPDKSNCPYHPFFIYKIVEQIVPNSKRKDEILSCIHLQSRETLIENDNIWFQICKDIPVFTKTATRI